MRWRQNLRHSPCSANSVVVDVRGKPEVMSDSGSFSGDEDGLFLIDHDTGAHSGTAGAALARVGGKAIDNAIHDIEVHQDGDGTWGFVTGSANHGGDHAEDSNVDMA